ncbi:MAG: ABC transporter ATP-binding protein [Clostridia bacterium]|nr:ABC transporter ATP-binding protein [Clostridia bacterium]
MKKTKFSQNPVKVWKNLWFMVQYVIKYVPSYIFVTLIEGVGRGFWHIFGVLFMKYLFDAVESGLDFATVMFWTVLWLAYQLVFELFNKWRLKVYVPKAKLVLHEKIQNELYIKARNLDQSCYDDPEFYNDFIWAIRESDERVSSIMENFGLFINRVICSAVVLGILVTLDLPVTVFLLVSLLVGFILKNILSKMNVQQDEEINPIKRKLEYIDRVFYLPDRAKELRLGGIAEYLHESYKTTVNERISCIKKWFKKRLKFSLVSDFIIEFMPETGATFYLLIRYILDPTLTLGSFTASFSAMWKLFWTIDDIGNYFTKFGEHSMYIEKVKRFIEYEPKIVGEVKEVPEFESLKVENLSFAYPFGDADTKILKNISFEIKKGEKIAFVGYNGAGKTTLIKLLMRLYDCNEGEIFYNGQNIKDFVPENYREHIGAVFQDYKVFAATVAENVLGGEFDPKNEEVVLSALKAASFGDKLQELPDGINSQLTTEFSADGVGLSGGESQKIAISRVFARPFELIIMDEPSSSLDPVAEFELNKSILKNAADKTIIFISHRLSTTQMADRIYMFDHGEIVEIGSHDELMALGGKYCEMYHVQAEKYSNGQFE